MLARQPRPSPSDPAPPRAVQGAERPQEEEFAETPVGEGEGDVPDYLKGVDKDAPVMVGACAGCGRGAGPGCARGFGAQVACARDACVPRILVERVSARGCSPRARPRVN